MHVFYLHGFTSAAGSSKARFFAERLAPHGWTLHSPDLNEPDFSTLTTSRMIARVEAALAALPPGPVALIGSSLGAFVAWHLTARHETQPTATSHPIDRLVLLAPALDFGASRMPELGPQGMQRWRETGWLELFHYAYGERRRVHYGLYEDAGAYLAADVVLTQPSLVFHGRRDALVDPAMVRAFVAARPSMTLVELDDDHQLHASLPAIWARTAPFLGLAAE